MPLQVANESKGEWLRLISRDDVGVLSVRCDVSSEVEIGCMMAELHGRMSAVPPARALGSTPRLGFPSHHSPRFLQPTLLSWPRASQPALIAAPYGWPRPSVTNA